MGADGAALGHGLAGRPLAGVVVLGCAGAIVVIEACGLAGLHLASEALLDLGAAEHPRRVLSAAGALAVAAGLAAYALDRDRAAAAAGVLAAGLGLLTLLQYGFGVWLPTDALYLGSGSGPRPGRMAPTTAVCLCLLGTGVWFLTRPGPRRTRVVTALAGLVAATGSAIALGGFLAGVDTTYGWGHLARMSPHTALAFTILGAGLGAAATAVRVDVASRPAWAPLVLGGLAVLLAFGLWQALIREGRQDVLARTQRIADRLGLAIEDRVAERLRLLDEVARSGGPPPRELLSALGVELLPRAAESSERAATGRSLVSADDGPAVIATASPRAGAAGAGSPRGRIDLAPVLEGTISPQDALGYGCNLLTASGAVVFGEGPREGAVFDRWWAVEAPLDLPGLAWRVHLWPTRAQLEEERSVLPELVLGLGLLLAFGVALLLELTQETQLRARDAERARSDAELARQEAVRVQEFLADGTQALAEANARLEQEVANRERYEQDLQSFSAALARSNQDLEQFAYVAAHDLKSPLRAIDQLSRWIEEDLAADAAPETAENLGLLRGRVKRMEALLDGLLQYSRVGRRQHDDEDVDVGALVGDVLDLIELPEGYRVDVDPDLPTLHTARAPLEQVFLNLIGNAAKHAGAAGGRIRVAGRPLDGEERWEFSVEDDGAGIPEEFREQVFGMFKTLRPRDEVEGSGMGLAVIKKTVEQYGGRITAGGSSALGGASFRFTWPAEPAAERILADD